MYWNYALFIKTSHFPICSDLNNTYNGPQKFWSKACHSMTSYSCWPEVCCCCIIVSGQHRAHLSLLQWNSAIYGNTLCRAFYLMQTNVLMHTVFPYVEMLKQDINFTLCSNSYLFRNVFKKIMLLKLLCMFFCLFFFSNLTWFRFSHRKPLRDKSVRENLLQKLVMDKSRAYVTLNILLTVGNSTNMSGLAAVNHA